MDRKVDDGRWTEKTRLEYEAILDTFIEVVGDKLDGVQWGGGRE